jgi:hypothetical protein
VSAWNTVGGTRDWVEGSYDWDHILLDLCGKRYEAEESAEV